MSETEIHVPHGHHGSDGLSQKVAFFTAIMAALGAVLGYQGSRLMEESLLQKNDAVLMKAHATDQWNYYQAVSTKAHLMELAKTLSPIDKQAGFDASIAKYKTQKTKIKLDAEKFETASAKANQRAAQLNAPHEMLAMAMIMLQISVALASVTALTKRGWLLGVALLCALTGLGFWAYGAIML